MEKPKILKSQFLNLTKESLCFVLSVVDNDYQHSDNVKNSRITRNLERNFLLLSSTGCDYASSIKIDFEGDLVSKITRMGEYTQNWQEIYPQTYHSIIQRFENLRTLGISA